VLVPLRLHSHQTQPKHLLTTPDPSGDPKRSMVVVCARSPARIPARPPPIHSSHNHLQQITA
jgi:hypothetical protein